MRKGIINYWLLFAFLIGICSLTVIYHQQNNNLAVHKAPDTTPSEPTVPDIALTVHKNEKHGFQYGIPDNWTKVIKSENDIMYVDQLTTMSAEIFITPKTTEIATMNADYLTKKLNEKEKTMQDFRWIDNTSYYALFKDKSERVYAFLTSFDRKTAITLTVSCPKEAEDKEIHTISKIIDSFAWKKEEPYPENVTIYYNSVGKIEFLVPLGWNITSKDNTLLAQSPDQTMLMTLDVRESNANYKNLTQLDYVNWASQGKSQYALKTFTKTDTLVQGTSTFVGNNQPMIMIDQLIANGVYEYTMRFECTTQAFEANKDAIFSIMNMIVFPDS